MTKNIFFFYLDDKIQADAEMKTGAEIKALIKIAVPVFELQHELVQEGKGNDPDKLIADGVVVDLSEKHGGPKHFFSRPPTNFGM